MISLAASKNGIDGTDVRLLKFLANKYSFSYNITIPDNYQAAISDLYKTDEFNLRTNSFSFRINYLFN